MWRWSVREVLLYLYNVRMYNNKQWKCNTIKESQRIEKLNRNKYKTQESPCERFTKSTNGVAGTEQARLATRPDAAMYLVLSASSNI